MALAFPTKVIPKPRVKFWLIQQAWSREEEEEKRKMLLPEGTLHGTSRGRNYFLPEPHAHPGRC